MKASYDSHNIKKVIKNSKDDIMMKKKCKQSWNYTVNQTFLIKLQVGVSLFQYELNSLFKYQCFIFINSF